MWRSRKLILVAILVAVVLSASALVTSCTSTGGEDEGVPGASPDAGSPEGTPPEGMSPGPGLPSDLLARVAEILGIDEQTLEDAFNQAQSEMAGGTALPSPNQ
jgi:hypothetical protein